MGRPARNYGGTGGHGYLPLPGERPNFHRHLLQDTTLTFLVKSSMKQTKKNKGVEIVKPFKNDEMKFTFNKASNSEKELAASAKQKVHVAKKKLNPKLINQTTPLTQTSLIMSSHRDILEITQRRFKSQSFSR